MLRFILKIIPLPLQLISLRFLVACTINNNPQKRKLLRDLEGRVIMISITDIKRSYSLSIKNLLLQVKAKEERAPDVLLKGDINTFVGLFKGRLDPDSVFFNRALKVDGDVATLVNFKNLLEAIK